MKTTIELPDDLLMQAKAVALRRHTTLKSVLEHALRREILEESTPSGAAELFTLNEYGFPVLRRPAAGKPRITSEMIYRMQEETEDAP
jgi:hypothetical protein